MTGQQKQNKFAQLRAKAEQLILQDDTFLATEAAHNMQQLIHVLQVHQTEMEIQNVELQRAQQELSGLHRGNENLYEFAPYGYLVLNSQGIITNANLTAVSLLGTSRSILLHSSFIIFLAPDWVDAYRSARKQALHTREKQSVELPLKGMPSQAAKWILAEIDAEKDEHDSLFQLRMVMVDITARKQAEQELKRIQWLLKPDHAPGENYVPEYGNLLDLNTRRVILDAVGQEVLTDIVKDFLDLLVTKEGYWIWILDRGKVIEWDESGNPLRMIGTYRGVKAEI